jgi:diadenosine tetraphosphate (Ap4A) HIT family hydrolase
MEGSFPSAYAHRIAPEGIETDEAVRKTSVKTRQVVIGSGSILLNETQKGQVLPMGYDRYSGMQFSNRDFVTNAVLWLTDSEGLSVKASSKRDIIKAAAEESGEKMPDVERVEEELTRAGVFMRIIAPSAYRDLSDNVPADTLGKLFSKVAVVAEKKGLVNGYRVLVNTGEDASQSVKHLHVHILGGGFMPRPNDQDWGEFATNAAEIAAQKAEIAAWKASQQ